MGDLAVVKLSQPLNFTEHIRPINLAESDPPNFSNVEILGWGRLYQDGPKPELLQYTSLSSLPHSQCKVYNPHGDESLLCLLPQRRDPSGVCNSDSGGPAVYNGYLVGIANYVKGLCGSPNPDVFANVAYYADWIKDNSDLQNSDSENSNVENVNTENLAVESRDSELSNLENVDSENTTHEKSDFELSNFGNVDSENFNAPSD